MSQSLAKVFLHLVFSTKERKKHLSDDINQRLYPYICSISQDIYCPVYTIGGIEDHIHILLEQSKNVTTSQLIKIIKSNSSKWLRKEFSKCREFSWQNGYAAFSVDHLSLERISQYIKNQKLHHAKRDYKEEIILLLTRYGINFDEKYLWN